MLFKKVIRQLVAAIVLLVFVLSITPQKTIHDIVAHHVDPSTCDVHLNLPIDQVENSSIHCTYDFLVATTAFIQYNFDLIVSAPELAPTTNSYLKVQYFLGAIRTKDSRGPPAV